MDKAKAALAEARHRNPAITVKWMMEHTQNLPAVLDGLRKAGCQRNEASLKGSLRERVRCSSLVDWPVYPRLAHTMRASNDAQCEADAGEDRVGIQCE